VLMRLSTRDNLRLGRVDPDYCFELFPELKSRVRTLAGDLSGGEQQMLTLVRALARSPKLLLADELSFGLAPLIVERLLRAIRAAASNTNVGVLIVEQQVGQVLGYTDRVYVMVRGQIEYEGSTSDFKEHRTEIEGAYLGGLVG
jgi:ABC-type branched-subunit amino acid transport system ATPase component